MAARLMTDANRLIIVSSPVGFPEALKGHLVPSQAPLTAAVGGPLVSLHARVARRILERALPGKPLDASVLAEEYGRLLARSPRRNAPDRRPASDEEILAFISKERRRDPMTRHTPLLRAFRELGNACEQARFRRLFEEATS